MSRLLPGLMGALVLVTSCAAPPDAAEEEGLGSVPSSAASDSPRAVPIQDAILEEPADCCPVGPADPQSREIASAAREYVRANSAVDSFRVEVESVVGTHARVRAIPVSETTDPATVYLRQENGRWRGLVIGTAFTPEDFERLRIPPEVRGGR